MHIGVLTSVHPPTDTRIYFKQVRTLLQAGHRVTYVARSGADLPDVEYIPLAVPKSRRQRLGTVNELYRKAKALNCDAYHLHDPELLVLAPLLRRATGARIVFDVHENIRNQIRSKYWIPSWLRPAVAAWYGGLERFFLRWVDDVVLAEDSYADLYVRTAPHIVRNYPILPPSIHEAASRSYSSKPKLVYCGVVAEIRGALEMIEATALLAADFPEVELHVIGQFSPETLRQRLEAEIQRLNLRDQVRLYGRMPIDQASKVVADCDIGLAVLHPDPNYLESLPTKMFEYMSAGLPVVVSDFPLWRSIVEPADCGRVVDPKQPQSIARAIEGICSAGNLGILGDNGRRTVLEKYNWEVEAKKLLKIYGIEATNEEEGTTNESTVHTSVLLHS